MKSHFFLFTLTCFLLTSGDNGALAGKNNLPEINGAYLGIFNTLYQKSVSDTSAKRTQFDMAANLDVSWRVHQKIRGIIQFQMGPGFGNIGFAFSEVVVTDLNLEFDVTNNFILTLGSFDTPFGADTPNLTNNADASNNAFYLNTLFHSAFAGTNVGTLNTIGIMGSLESKWGGFAAVFTNGTDESAFNGDGDFEVVLSGLSRKLIGNLQVGASYLNSPDSSRTGTSGTGSKFQGGILDVIYNISDLHFMRAYYGRLKYDDSNPATKDDVIIWKAEAKYQVKNFFVAGRVSRWEPEDSKADGSGISASIPTPGYGRSFRDFILTNDQEVTRFQVAGGWQFEESVIIKAEWFLDDYRQSLQGKSFDVNGLILGVNVLF
jgi:hypothetical protein